RRPEVGPRASPAGVAGDADGVTHRASRRMGASKVARTAGATALRIGTGSPRSSRACGKPAALSVIVSARRARPAAGIRFSQGNHRVAGVLRGVVLAGLWLAAGAAAAAEERVDLDM